MRRRRRALSLLEVVIALSLTSILLFFLFGFYRQLTLLDVQAEKIQERISAREKTQLRLMQIFSNLPPEDEKTPPLFYTESTPEGVDLSLVFSFDQGVDTEEKLSGKVRGVLLLTKKGLLELHTLPLEGESIRRREVLMQQVNSLSFSFFDPIKESWVTSWDQENESLPPMVKISLKEKEEVKPELDSEAKPEVRPEISFAFFLPPSQLPTFYEQ
ncbi:MAG: hypothetical protein HYX48_00005 [Chlamydiales bacterium]|nr:hypothetical protein [Chlamydiales bacterium]